MKKTYSLYLKFKIALAALTGQPIIDIYKQYEVAESLVYCIIEERAKRTGGTVFSQKRKARDTEKELETVKLYQHIGELSTQVELLNNLSYG